MQSCTQMSWLVLMAVPWVVAPMTATAQSTEASTVAREAHTALFRQLRDIDYRGIYDQPVHLSEGHYEGPPFVAGGASRPTVSLTDLVAFGDLDADGRDDAAVLLVESSGGSGSFVYLAAVLATGRGAANAATVLVGDRNQVQTLRIDAGAIVVDYVTQGAQDPEPLPSVKRRAGYRLQGNELVKVLTEELGVLAVKDLEGAAWVLSGLGRDPDLQGRIGLRFAAGRITGSAGCNRYSAALHDKGGGALEVGPVVSTRMACPEPLMTQESAYLSRLGKVNRFGFDFGRLALTYDSGMRADALLFDAERQAGGK